MTLSDFVTGLEMELRLRAVPCDRGDLETWAADVWPLAEEMSESHSTTCAQGSKPAER
jgi:hypothetical protein